jgi:4-diphosphocytidyl-2-C-methyl-D-erythritol kinase
MIRRARLKAFAKLNLGLRVLYKRPDGYHELRTIFQTISLADRITVSFEPARKAHIEIGGAPEIEDNLLTRAAALVLEQLRVRGRVSFHLEKAIPMGAGLGGGSSDAAAVLLALPVLVGKTLAGERARAIALELGSDVPFFLHGGTALGMGRGEELYPLPDLRRSPVLVVAPEIHSSTVQAYRDLSPRLTTESLQNKLLSFQQEVWQGASASALKRESAPPLERQSPSALNDFEEVVFARHPELRSVRDRLRRTGARCAAMTGSGSAIFGIFDDSASLERARSMFPRDRVFSVSFLSRAQYRSAWKRALKQHTEGDQWPPRSLYAQ